MIFVAYFAIESNRLWPYLSTTSYLASNVRPSYDNYRCKANIADDVLLILEKSNAKLQEKLIDETIKSDCHSIKSNLPYTFELDLPPK